MNKSVSCPVDHVQINENKARVIAFLVLLSALLYLAIHAWFILFYLAIDFLLRAGGWERHSIYARLSGLIIAGTGIKNKPVDRAPKRFAAGMGLLFILAITASHFLKFTQTAILLTTVLCLFAFLESVFAVCTGCYVYHLLNRFKNGKP